jgi:hypothetical protein
MSAISQLPAVTAAGTDRIPLARLSSTDVYTAGTISAAASDNSLNDSAASFPAWLLPGLRINIAAFTGDTDNNHDSATVVSATTAKVVLGADTPLVDDAAGESVTITAWESKRTTAQEVADLAVTSGPSVASRYVIDLASQADSDPGSGKLRFNHATPTSATKIFLDDETSDGVDLSTALLDLGSSGYIRIQSVDDVGEWLYAKWTAITDDTGYFDIAITVLASKGTLDDTDAVLVTFDAKGSGGAGSAGRHAIFIAAGSIRPSAVGGCQSLASIASAADQPDITTLDFDATTQEYSQFNLVMPKSWDEGTITFVPVWSHAATTTNFGVVWALQAVAVSNDDGIAAAYGTSQHSTDTGGTTNDIYFGPESSSMTVAGSPAAEDMVCFRLSRVTGNGSDTMAIDARLHGVVLYITTDASNDA